MILKCKMCGDNLSISEDKSSGTCESCGSVMTLPSEDKGMISEETIVKQVKTSNDIQAESFVKRANLFLEDKNWPEATTYYNKALDIDPKCSSAYLGLVCAEKNVQEILKFKLESKIYDPNFEVRHLNTNNNYKKAKSFSQDTQYFKKIEEQLVVRSKRRFYDKCLSDKENASTYMKYNGVARNFNSLKDYKDAKEQMIECENLAKQCVYDEAMSAKRGKNYSKAQMSFKKVLDYKDAKEQAEECASFEFESSYDKAKKTFERSDRIIDKIDALYIFLKIKDYKDSGVYIDNIVAILQQNKSANTQMISQGLEQADARMKVMENQKRLENSKIEKALAHIEKLKNI